MHDQLRDNCANMPDQAAFSEVLMISSPI